MLIIEKLSIPAGIAAAMASGEYQDRNILSTKCCTDHVAVDNMRGSAMTRTSWYPPSLFQCLFKYPMLIVP